MRSNIVRLGVIHAVTCPSCDGAIFEYGSGDGDKRVRVYPLESATTRDVVIIILVEIEDHKRRASGKPAMTDDEKDELRKDPSIIEKAKTLIQAAMASTVGSAAGNILSGLLTQ